jgi:predicted alpha/beta hydrolase family esterase
MQVLVIHGAGGFVSLDRADFIAGLKAREVTLESLRRQGDWKSNLQKNLGPGFDVLHPRMPDADAPYYEAWKAWLENIIPLLDDEVVLVGHSLGGLLLTKYLSENEFPKKVKALILVATPYTGPEVAKELLERLGKGGWLLGADISKVADQAESIFVVHSKDDHVVPFGAAEAYVGKLPKAKIIALEGKGHIREESLPEVEDIIRGL